MPFVRYFACVGGVLLALLFIVDWWLPPSGYDPAGSAKDHSAIQIHSTHRWPKAVVFDTSQPTFVPPPTTVTALQPPPLPKPVREAYALAEATPEAKPAEVAKPAKPHGRRPKVARATTGQDVSKDMFGFRNDFFVQRPMWSSRW